MKHIHETTVSTYSDKLKQLGIDTEDWIEYMIVLNHVSSYSEYTNEAGNIDEDKTTVYCCDQGATISTPYIEFHKIMKEYLQD